MAVKPTTRRTRSPAVDSKAAPRRTTRAPRSAVSSSGDYNEDSIQHFEGLEGVRQKPGMYLGERGPQMAFRALKEVVDNCYDEYSAGRNSEIEVVLDTKNLCYIVADKAQGIPVGLHKVSKMSTLTLIFTKLHAGGKFNDKAYKSSAGTHGVGAACSNAVSDKFEVWTKREGVWYHQAFSKGKPLADVKKSNPPSRITDQLQAKPTKGTIVCMSLDQSIVSADKGKTKAKVDVAYTAAWLRNLALMNKNLKITLTANGKTKTYLNTVGISKMLTSRIEKDELEVMGKPLIFEDDFISVAIQWTSYTEEDGVTSYVSSSLTRDGGTHLDEFYDALTKSLSGFKSTRDKYAPRDLRNGLVGILNFKMSQPEFSSQVKDRLTSNLGKSVFDKLLPFFNEFFSKNKSLARKILVRASNVKKTKEQFKKLMDGIVAVNQSKRGVMLPNILASAKCSPDKRELFIVEGDSAAGCGLEDVMLQLQGGEKISFGEMTRRSEQGEVFHGYAFDKATGQTVPIEFDTPRLTKYVNEYVEVELSDGSVHKFTADHPWLLANGAYVAAETLVVGDEVQLGELDDDTCLNSEEDPTVRKEV